MNTNIHPLNTHPAPKAKTHHAPAGQPPAPRPLRLLKLPEVQDRCGIRKSAIYASMKAGTFPPCVRIGQRAVAWRESCIEAWIESRTHADMGSLA